MTRNDNVMQRTIRIIVFVRIDSKELIELSLMVYFRNSI